MVTRTGCSAVAVLVLLTGAACDSGDPPPPPVPACTPTEATTTWSNLQIRHQLVGAVIYDAAGARLDSWLRPLAPAISGPAQWQPTLLSSLGERSGRELAVEPTDTDPDAVGDPPIAGSGSDRQVGYESATRVYADFTVSCPDGPVTGTAESWTGGATGTMVCEVVAMPDTAYGFLSPFCVPNPDLANLKGSIEVDPSGVLGPDTIVVPD